MSHEVGRIINKEFEMEYLKFGEGEKTLVIIPGLSVQSVIPLGSAIEKQYSVFKDDFTVYLFDRRKNLPPAYSVSDMADDTAKAIKELGLSDVCLFGTSQGGMILMILAARCPELVARLALGSTACRETEEIRNAVCEWISFAEKGEREKLYLSFGEKLYSPETFSAFRETLIKMSETVEDNDLKRFIILANALYGLDFRESLRKISCPVLALNDESDKVLGADAASEIAKQMKNNECFESYIYSGFGHAVYDTAPDFTSRLYDFFTK